MGQTCSVEEIGKPLPSFSTMLLSDYSGPFRVPNLNSTAFEDEYERGKGTDRVFIARNRITRTLFVAYKLPKIECPCNDGDVISGLIKKLQKLDHPNVCRLFEAFDDPAFVILVYQELPKVSLLESIKEIQHMSEQRAAEICLNLVRSIIASASMDLVHGALSPKHILMRETRPVVIDVGLIDTLKQDPIHKLNRDVLSYVAPEVIEPWFRKQEEAGLTPRPRRPVSSIGEGGTPGSPGFVRNRASVRSPAGSPRSARGPRRNTARNAVPTSGRSPSPRAGKAEAVHEKTIDRKSPRRSVKLVPLPRSERARKTIASDVWSVGVILFQLLSGKLPFHGRSLISLADRILHSDPDIDGCLSKVSKEARQLIKQLLAKDPKQRPDPEQLLRGGWLSDEFEANRCTAPVEYDVIENLATLAKESQFKKAMLQLIAEKMLPSEVATLENVFAKIDSGGDGFVSLHELRDCVKAHPQLAGRVDVEEAFAAIDEDGGGVISLREFVMATLDTQHVVLENAMWDAFKAIDKNHDGYLTKKELMAVIRELGGGGRLCEERLEEIESIIVLEVPNKITFEEFTKLLREEGGRRKRLILGHCAIAKKTCNSVVKVGGRHYRACMATM
mmetsp:Transcript_85684/g.239444  ORF Transcript_85684/g.239444 Transcript_85684/m.239444 type:complete len:617 (-) Transcript_85684:105-1955(-)